MNLSLDEKWARISHALPGAGELPRHTAEFIVAAWLVVARQATGLDFAPAEVSFRHSPPADVREHQRLFRAPVRFGGSANGMLLPRDLLGTPLLRADPGLCVVLERHLRELVERTPPASSVVDRVRQLVASELPRIADATAVARKLRMSRRTLQRQLGAGGTTFTGLLDVLRRELAMRYLHERQIAIAEVAFLLGFSEASTFHRAFRRWSGTTPAAYRKTALASVK